MSTGQRAALRHPGQQHSGEAEGILAHRREVFEAAKQRHPERWSSDIRKLSLPDDDDLLKVLLGIFSILFGLWGLLKPFRGRLMPTWIGRLCGGIAGFTSFTAHAGGPPLNFYLLQCRLAKEQFLGTAVVFLAALNLVKLVPYGLLSLENLTVALLLIPIVWLGVRLGLVIQKRLSGKLFFRIILTLLVLLGIRLIVDGAG